MACYQYFDLVGLESQNFIFNYWSHFKWILFSTYKSWGIFAWPFQAISVAKYVFISRILMFCSTIIQKGAVVDLDTNHNTLHAAINCGFWIKHKIIFCKELLAPWTSQESSNGIFVIRDRRFFFVLSVILSFCPPNWNLNPAYNLWTVSARALIFHKNIPCDKTFPWVPLFLPRDLDLGVWPVFWKL